MCLTRKVAHYFFQGFTSSPSRCGLITFPHTAATQLHQLWACSTKALEVAARWFPCLGNGLTPMVLHEAFVATLVVITTIAATAAGLHAKTNLSISRSAGSTERADLIGSTVVLSAVFGGGVTETIGVGGGKKAHTHGFIGASTHVATNNRAIATRAIHITDSFPVGRTVSADRARIADLITTSSGGQDERQDGEKCGWSKHRRRILQIRLGLVSLGCPLVAKVGL